MKRNGFSEAGAGFNSLNSLLCVMISMIMMTSLSCSGITDDSQTTLSHPHQEGLSTQQSYNQIVDKLKHTYVFQFRNKNNLPAQLRQDLSADSEANSNQNPDSATTLYPMLCAVEHRSGINYKELDDDIDSLKRNITCHLIYRDAQNTSMALDLKVIQETNTYAFDRMQTLSNDPWILHLPKIVMAAGWSILPTTIFLQFASFDYSTGWKWFRPSELRIVASFAAMAALTVGSIAYLKHDQRHRQNKIKQYYSDQGLTDDQVPEFRLKQPYGISNQIYEHLLSSSISSQRKRYDTLPLNLPINHFIQSFAQEYNESLILYDIDSEPIHTQCFPDEDDISSLQCQQL